MGSSSDTIVCPHGTGDSRTICGALAAARPGGRIIVRPGTYPEQLDISRPIEIIGPEHGQAIIETNGVPCVQMAAATATISRISFSSGTLESDAAAPAINQLRGILVLEQCDIRSGITGVFSAGPGTRLEMRDCCIRSCVIYGLVIAAGAELVVEHSLFEGNGLSDIAVDAGNACVTSCSFKDCRKTSIYFTNHSHGMLDRCDIAGARSCGMIIENGSDPHIRGCRIRESGDRGISFQAHGRGTVEDCDILDNQGSGITHGSDSAPVLRSCRIHGNGWYGIQMFSGARAIVEDCDVWGNVHANIWISHNAAPMIQRCTVRNGQEHGFFIDSEGHGLVEDCLIEANDGAGVGLFSGSDTAFKGCTIRGNKDIGALMAGGTLENCTIAQNGGYAAVMLSQGHTSLRGCTITASTDGVFGAYGNAVVIHNIGTRATFEACELKAFQGHALHVGAAQDVVLRRCKLAVDRGPALQANHAKLFAEDCTVTAAEGAVIAADSGTNLTIRRTAVSGGQIGIRVDSGSHVTVVDSEILGMLGTGIHIGQMGTASLQDCAIAVVRGIGINARAMGQCQGERCSIDVSIGLWVRGDAAARVELSRCSLRGERVGIHIGRYASGIMSDCSVHADREISLIADPHGALSLQRSALQEGTGSRATIKQQGNVVTAPEPC